MRSWRRSGALFLSVSMSASLLANVPVVAASAVEPEPGAFAMQTGVSAGVSPLGGTGWVLAGEAQTTGTGSVSLTEPATADMPGVQDARSEKAVAQALSAMSGSALGAASSPSGDDGRRIVCPGPLGSSGGVL